MMNIPEARANAAEASLPTLVDDGNAFFSIRRMHANGGSNSAAEGNAVDAADFVADDGGGNSDDGSSVEGAAEASGVDLSCSSMSSLPGDRCGVVTAALIVVITSVLRIATTARYL